jgi:hypothetical protein
LADHSVSPWRISQISLVGSVIAVLCGFAVSIGLCFADTKDLRTVRSRSAAMNPGSLRHFDCAPGDLLFVASKQQVPRAATNARKTRILSRRREE